MKGLRFRKNVSIIPGVRLNLSKTGVSVSIGGHGMTFNIGKNGLFGTAGLPGSGMSYRKQLVDKMQVGRWLKGRA